MSCETAVSVTFSPQINLCGSPLVPQLLTAVNACSVSLHCWQYHKYLIMKEFYQEVDCDRGKKKSASHKKGSMTRLCSHDKIQPLVPDKGPPRLIQRSSKPCDWPLTTQSSKATEWSLCRLDLLFFSTAPSAVHAALSLSVLPLMCLHICDPDSTPCLTHRHEGFAKPNTKYNEIPKWTLL